MARVLAIASQAGEGTDTNMATELRLPKKGGGGPLLHEADSKDIEYWLPRKEAAANDPQNQYAASDKKWVAEAKRVLAERAVGGSTGQAMVPAGQAHQGQLVARGPDDARRLEGSYSTPDKVRQAMERAAACGHLVTPVVGCLDIPEGCSIALTVVHVSVDADTYSLSDGDNAKRGLSKTALQRIAAAAGISWDATQSGRTDTGVDPHYCAWKSVGTYRSFDGVEIQIVGAKEMDLREKSAAVEALYQRYEADKKAWDAGRSRKKYPPKDPTGQIREMRLHIAAHAETKAQLRAIRSIGVKTGYTAVELQRPFVVARLMFTGRTDNATLAEKFATMRATAMLGGARALYGVTQAAPQIVAQQVLAPPPPVKRTLDDDDLPPDSGPYTGGYTGGYEPADMAPPPFEPGPPPEEPPPPRARAARRAPVEPPPNAGDSWVPDEGLAP